MKQKQVVFFGLILFLISFTVFSQDVTIKENKTRKNAIGLHAGSTTGFGISYRRWPDQFGFQVTFFPIVSKEQSYISLGITGMYKVSELKAIDVFLYLGDHFIYRKDNYYYDPAYYQDYDSNGYWTWNLGAGGGLDIKIAKVLRLSIMTGFGNYDILGDYTFTFAGEIGFYYMF
jgi:hypothetical protein